MTVQLQLRAWQSRFAGELAAHPADDFLLVACPAAGKTLAAAAAIARVMADRDCDQLVVVCPTIVVRDQWALVLGELGFRVSTAKGAWPEHVHGVCVTYQAIAQRVDELREACAGRRTVVILDEVHHAGEQWAWGAALAEAFGGACLRLLLSGTPFRSDRERIPFLSYDAGGQCIPDFTYDYPRAVRDGVCRSIEFRAHDGVITWQDAPDDDPVTATFAEDLDPNGRARRLRASLDPGEPYLAALLADAHQDLLTLRETVPDAAGLVVCDSQAHAMEIDELLGEITGRMPVLAISDQPRAHQAIRAFASQDSEWLVSVRMVAEGVDIPRLAVIAWATASRTELMVRQVAGRALRGRGDHANLPAVVHMPADPQLMAYAGRLNILGGVALRPSHHGGNASSSAEAAGPVIRRRLRIDPTPFVVWWDRMAGALGAGEVARRCGWSEATGVRRVYAWRTGTHPDVMNVYDACHFAGVDFDTLFADPEYSAARSYVNGGPSDTAPASKLRALEALPTATAPATVTPPLPAGRRLSALEMVEIAAPALPPSPEEVAAAEEARMHARAELFRLLGLYTQLRRRLQPGFQLASANAELTRAVGAVLTDAPDDRVAAAVAWVKARTADLAAKHPEALIEMRREHRRLANA